MDLNISLSYEDILTTEEEFLRNSSEIEDSAESVFSQEREIHPNNHLSHHNQIDLNNSPYPQGTRDYINEEFIFDTSELSSSEGEKEMSNGETQVKKRKILSNDTRQAIYEALPEKSVNGKLKKNSTRIVASIFSVSMREVQRIWKRSKESTGTAANVCHRKTKNCGRKRIQIDVERFQRLPLQKRTTIHSPALAMNISPSLIYSNYKRGIIKKHTNPHKPFLTDDNKKARQQFCLSMLEEDSLPHEPIFKDMYNVIHIDEKWFNMSKNNEKYYLLADEDEPYRSCKSKNFVTKVMFLSAIARPRFDAEGKEIFSGKIGIFLFVTKEPAKRRSVNRPAGTIETKAMTSVRRDTVRSVLIKNVIPAILEKWPREDASLPIFIQQDNAKTHIEPNDREFCEAVQQSGLDIQIRFQPPNSPDFNVLDLGFLRAIQSLKNKEAPRTVDELLKGVEKAFENFPSVMSNGIFFTLQSCMEAAMKVRGGNNYKIPHMAKNVLEKNGQLPSQLTCDAQLYKDVNYIKM